MRQKYPRTLKIPEKESVLLLGPRGTGKTSYLLQNFPNAQYFDLLDASIRMEFLSQPQLLHEVHRLIEKKKIRFILTGSSARKLRKVGTNLLAGRALSYFMHPFNSLELGNDFQLKKAILRGLLPRAYLGGSPQEFLKSYVGTYLKEEVGHEGLVRSLESFSRFLQIASFSQASLLNINKVAMDAGIGRQAAKGYFEILRDLLLSIELPIFSLRAKRELVKHRKFYFFDAGVYRAIRPTGPLDSTGEINGIALETLVLQELKSLNDTLKWNLDIFFWRSLREKLEVDFILYGSKVFTAIEVKGSSRLQDSDLKPLLAFKKDYPEAKAMLLYTGTRNYHHEGIEIVPLEEWYKRKAENRLKS